MKLKEFIRLRIDKKVRNKIDTSNVFEFKMVEYKNTFIVSGSLAKKTFKTRKDATKYIVAMLNEGVKHDKE
ncbi:MAG: hypothetical protein ACRCUM_02345 [Mycoplasmoidaceae bacterium]